MAHKGTRGRAPAKGITPRRQGKGNPRRAATSDAAAEATAAIKAMLESSLKKYRTLAPKKAEAESLRDSGRDVPRALERAEEEYDELFGHWLSHDDFSFEGQVDEIAAQYEPKTREAIMAFVRTPSAQIVDGGLDLANAITDEVQNHYRTLVSQAFHELWENQYEGKFQAAADDL